jgi:hypothetical protein
LAAGASKALVLPAAGPLAGASPPDSEATRRMNSDVRSMCGLARDSDGGFIAPFITVRQCQVPGRAGPGAPSRPLAGWLRPRGACHCDSDCQCHWQPECQCPDSDRSAVSCREERRVRCGQAQAARLCYCPPAEPGPCASRRPSYSGCDGNGAAQAAALNLNLPVKLRCAPCSGSRRHRHPSRLAPL